MSTQQVCHEVYRAIFTSNKEAVKLNSQAVAAFDFRSSQSGSNSCQVPQQLREQSHDFWVSRVSCLQVRIDVRFELQLFLQIRKSTQLFESLKCSILYAELWSQLGLVVSLVDQCIQSTHAPGFCFDVSLKNASTIQDIDNLRPPVSVRVYHLSSIDMQLKYSLKDSSCTYQMSIAREKKIFIRLLDAALRSFICRDPTRIWGVSEIGSKPTMSLSMVAPSTFAPRYAELMASRVRLLEPITKTILTFRDIFNSKSGFSPSKAIRCAIGGGTTIDAEVISAGLWMTMANALQNDQQAKRLPPLKLESRHQAPPFSDWELECAAEPGMTDGTRVLTTLEKCHQPNDCLLLGDLDENQRQDYARFYHDHSVVFTCTAADPGSKRTRPLTLGLSNLTSESEVSIDLLEAQAWESENVIWDSNDTHVYDNTELSDSVLRSDTNLGLSGLPVQKIYHMECKSTVVSDWLEDIPNLHQIWQDENTCSEGSFGLEDQDVLPKWMNRFVGEVDSGLGMILHEDPKHETEQDLIDFLGMLK